MGFEGGLIDINKGQSQCGGLMNISRVAAPIYGRDTWNQNSLIRSRPRDDRRSQQKDAAVETSRGWHLAGAPPGPRTPAASF
jgi:hypothetical protein